MGNYSKDKPVEEFIQKHCNYCSGETVILSKFGDYKLYIENSNINLEVWGHDNDFFDKNRNTQARISYCPMCGRKLKEKL